MPVQEFDLTDVIEQGRPVLQQLWIAHHTTGTFHIACDYDREREWVMWLDDYHRRIRQFPNGIGYHCVVFPCGHRYKTGNFRTIRSHVRNYNGIFAGIAFVGTFLGDDRPTDEAIASAAEHVRQNGGVLAGGHKDADEPGYTQCPGDWDLNLIRGISGDWNQAIDAAVVAVRLLHR